MATTSRAGNAALGGLIVAVAIIAIVFACDPGSFNPCSNGKSLFEREIRETVSDDSLKVYGVVTERAEEKVEGRVWYKAYAEMSVENVFGRRVTYQVIGYLEETEDGKCKAVLSSPRAKRT